MKLTTLGHAIDDISKIGFGIEPIELGGRQHGGERGGVFAAGLGTEEQEVFTGDGDAAQTAFGGIVVDRQTAITGVARERVPSGRRILDRLGERSLR
jgi:hypothetical protein